MAYNVVMPVLSDTMDKGILVKWHKKDGDLVKKGEIIAEVESDKAVLEIESFYDGYIHLLANEGDEIEVKNTIAIIDDNPNKKIEQKIQIPPKQKIEKKSITKKTTSHKTPLPSGNASPLAKNLAKKYNIDLSNLPTPAHEKDIKEYLLNRYFTPKAKKLVLEYNLFDEFKLNHKIDSNEVLEYIKQNNIPKQITLTPNQQAVIKNVEKSIKKPTFRIFEEVDIKETPYKLTTIFIKALSNTMMKHPKSRTNEEFLEYPTSNISIAVNRDDGLYMVVLKNIEDLSLEEINNFLKEVKTKRLTIKDLKDSTFGLSNLGMFGSESFDSLINDKDSGILSIGANKNGKIKLTFTFDHRIFNGVDGALFVKDFKEEFNNLKEQK